MRGRVGRPMGGCAAGRITPARAGKSAMSDALPQNALWITPRVRGRVYLLNYLQYNYRITPARAGKRGAGSLHGQPAEDHPRACGEELRIFARGERSRDHPRACGEEALQTKVLAGATDHPRACGEEWVTVPGPISYSGSPPRVREENLWFSPASWSMGSPPRVRGRAISESCRQKKGITPARAGKRADWLAPDDPRRDHPRACGEELIHFGDEILCLGSPPRVRGRALNHTDQAVSMGITPARAGKSLRVM